MLHFCMKSLSFGPPPFLQQDSSQLKPGNTWACSAPHLLPGTSVCWMPAKFMSNTTRAVPWSKSSLQLFPCMEVCFAVSKPFSLFFTLPFILENSCLPLSFSLPGQTLAVSLPPCLAPRPQVLCMFHCLLESQHRLLGTCNVYYLSLAGWKLEL